MIDTQVQDERWMHRIGGISALAVGFGYIAIIVLFARVGAPPDNGEAWLKYLVGKTNVWWAILGVSVLTDFLFIPVGLSLYLALRRVSESRALLGCAFILLFVVLDLAVTWTNYGSLLTLSHLHTAAATDAQRNVYVAAANYAASVLASRTEVYYAIVDLSLGILIIGLVMLRANGIFGKTETYLGLATGISGIACVSTFFPVILLNAVCATVWALAVGTRLIKLSRK